MLAILLKSFLTSLVTVLTFLFAITAFAEEHDRSLGNTPPMPAQADQTAPAEQDRSGNFRIPDSQVTATQQGRGTAADLAISRQIRQDLVSDSTLSITAKNVGITALNNVVTLKGTVKSTAEKNRINQLARAAAGNYQIRDELKVAR